MNDEIAISLRNVSKKYKLYDQPIDRLKEALHPLKKQYHKDFYALRDINLEVKKGEVLGLVGVNGAGKSTLLKIISGVISASTGSVNVSGRLNAILELNSGLKPEMTGLENIRLNLLLNGIELDKGKHTQDIIDFADIGDHINQPVKTYSSGMKSRLGFGIATSTDPDILIVDEVLAVGDVLFQRKCYSKIEKLFKSDKAVIFVSHNTQSVIQFCSRAVLLYDRQIIMDDKPKKVTDFYQKLVFSEDKQNAVNQINLGQRQVNAKEISKPFGTFIYSENDYTKALETEPKVLNNVDLKLDRICILNEKNQVVNRLISGEKYKIYFDVKAERLPNITLGVAIQTVAGNTLCSKREGIKQGNIRIYWHFKCNLLNHKYFIKIDFRNGDGELYYQGTDILAFDVQRSSHKDGFVDMEQELEIL